MLSGMFIAVQLIKGASLHTVALYNNQWYNIDNGLQDDGTVLHCLSSYSVDNCNIEPPYAINNHIILP